MFLAPLAASGCNSEKRQTCERGRDALLASFEARIQAAPKQQRAILESGLGQLRLAVESEFVRTCVGYDDAHLACVARLDELLKISAQNDAEYGMGCIDREDPEECTETGKRKLDEALGECAGPMDKMNADLQSFFEDK